MRRAEWIAGLLILGGCGLWLAAGAIRGDISPTGKDLRAVGDAMMTVSLASFGAGAATLGVAGPGRLQEPAARLGLGIVAVGLAALAVSTLVPIPAGTNSLQSWPYILAVGLGLAATAGGALLTAVALLRASGRAGPPR